MKTVNEICLASNEELEKLTRKLKQSKIFLNMVIHDMRNPTVSSKAGI